MSRIKQCEYSKKIVSKWKINGVTFIGLADTGAEGTLIKESIHWSSPEKRLDYAAQWQCEIAIIASAT